jgi:hypothetical protein
VSGSYVARDGFNRVFYILVAVVEMRGEAEVARS